MNQQTMTTNKNNPTYIGDGVYVFFNGWSYEISVNDHRNPPILYLEPEVLENLIKLYKETNNDNNS